MKIIDIYNPNVGQYAVHECDHEFVFVTGGRASGKTTCLCADAVKFCLENPSITAIVWGSFFYSGSIRLLEKMIEDSDRSYKHHYYYNVFVFSNGSELFYRCDISTSKMRDEFGSMNLSFVGIDNYGGLVDSDILQFEDFVVNLLITRMRVGGKRRCVVTGDGVNVSMFREKFESIGITEFFI